MLFDLAITLGECFACRIVRKAFYLNHVQSAFVKKENLNAKPEENLDWCHETMDWLHSYTCYLVENYK